ncbi:MAG TPA: M13 family metallopeptidase [Gemmatimonadales bacterium]|nr:M13 family metallopeptidase [Gemmatimonadales bacterium]
MKRISVLTLAGALALAPVAATAQQAKPIDPANVDTTCAACQDFFRYANGGWLKRATIPADQSRWGSFDELYQNNLAALRATLEDAAAGRLKDADGRMLGAFYGSCMDSTAIDRAGARPLQPWFREIAAVRDRAALVPALARLHAEGFGAGFGFRAGSDDKNSERVIATLSQGGLGLPDRDYYTKTDSASGTLRAKYVAHLTAMFRLAGDDAATAARAAADVVALETAMAQASMTRTERRNPDSTYHLMPVSALAQTAPNIAWPAFFAGAGVKEVAEVNVRQPRFVAAFDSLVAAAPLDAWRSYLRWRVIQAMAPTLSTPFVRQDFAFNSTTLRGVAEMQPRWKRCVRATDANLGEVLGKAYVKTHFTPEAKARALAMVRNIQAEFRARLAALTWMSPATKARAAAKLDAIVNKIGYPDKWRDYAGLTVTRASYAENVRRVAAFETRRNYAKLGKPLDRTEWGMTPPTVNAYYSASLNEIVFPAGIMQPPFFDPKADDAVNYGGMGAVIGHEITHGFDDQGRKYDAKGNLSGWWSDEDSRQFDARAQVVVDQFSGYTVLDSLHVNGRLTLGENLADLGGLTIAYGAYRRSLEGKGEPAPIDGFTGDQRFFLAWAQIWRQVVRPETSRLLVATDPHSPGEFRTNGPLSNLPAFHRAFGCKPGDPMVRSDSLQAQVW